MARFVTNESEVLGPLLVSPAVVLLLLLLVSPAAANDLSVSVSNTAMNVVSRYNFTIRLSGTFASGSTIALTFPQEYSSATLQSMAPYSGSSFKCQRACGDLTFAFNGSTLFVSGAFTINVTTNFSLIFSVFNIKNPGVL